MITRRLFLTTSSLAAVAATGRGTGRALAPWPRSRGGFVPLGDLPTATDPAFKELAMRALDATKAGGASYADVRFTVTRWRTYNNPAAPADSTEIAVGVRALAQGAWGFATDTTWDPDIVVQLGQKAAGEAVVDAWPRVPPITLIDHPPVATGHWETPIRRDPFSVASDDVIELMGDLQHLGKLVKGRTEIQFNFERQDRVFASTDGAYTTQTIYTSLGGMPHLGGLSNLTILVKDQQGRVGQHQVPLITPTGAGYEVVEDAQLLDHFREWANKAHQQAPAKPFSQLGEYDVVFDGAAMAAIVDGTFGLPLEYDRAVGYEVAGDGSGGSYLVPPLKILGTRQAPEAVTITADRAMPRGVATVRWDAEGVEPVATPLVKDGVVVDYATSREFVAELAPWYRKHSYPLRSNGCAAAESAGTVPLVSVPNLILSPGAATTSFTDLVAQVDDGFAVLGGRVQMDMQGLTGRGEGVEVYEIKHGKLGAPIKQAAYVFHSQALWKRLKTLGGASTAMTCGLSTAKGEPDQGMVHSVQAVAAHFERVQLDNALTS